jgi:hypothetical protein
MQLRAVSYGTVLPYVASSLARPHLQGRYPVGLENTGYPIPRSTRADLRTFAKTSLVNLYLFFGLRTLFSCILAYHLLCLHIWPFFIPTKQITHVFLSALDTSGLVYIQMLKLYIATCFGLQIDHL